MAESATRAAHRNRTPRVEHDPVLVIGLGRFGSAVAESLVKLGHEVLGVDARADLVQAFATRLTHVVEADSTNELAMRQLGAAEFRRAVVGIGTDIEASVLTTMLLVDMGVSEIWVKATTLQHGQILERIGAHHVVFPEHAMGERVAHLVDGKMIDFIEFDDGFAIVKTRAPREAINRTLSESALRTKYGVTIVGTKRPGQDFVYAVPETMIVEGDTLIVAGKTADCERFASMT